MNPLISKSKQETAQNTAEALSAVMELLSYKDNNLYRLLSPIQAAIDHLADTK